MSDDDDDGDDANQGLWIRGDVDVDIPASFKRADGSIHSRRSSQSSIENTVVPVESVESLEVVAARERHVSEAGREMGLFIEIEKRSGGGAEEGIWREGSSRASEYIGRL